MEILRPIFGCEALVLDELGAAKPTEWVWDTIAHRLNTRDLKKLTTFVTNQLSRQGSRHLICGTRKDVGRQDWERMRSRLNEMYQTIEIFEDVRKNAGKASFTPWKGEFKQTQ